MTAAAIWPHAAPWYVLSGKYFVGVYVRILSISFSVTYSDNDAIISSMVAVAILYG